MNMTFILVDDEKRCNFCVYWTGKRKEDEDFVYVDFDSAKYGISDLTVVGTGLPDSPSKKSALMCRFFAIYA